MTKQDTDMIGVGKHITDHTKIKLFIKKNICNLYNSTQHANFKTELLTLAFYETNLYIKNIFSVRIFFLKGVTNISYSFSQIQIV